MPQEIWRALRANGAQDWLDECGCCTARISRFVVFRALGSWDFVGASFSQSDAVQALGILAAGQAINALSGPVMYLLNMTGGERVGLVILAVSAACQLTAGAIWIPEFGLVGAASSACFGMVVWNVVSLIWVRKTYGFWMVSLMNGWWRRN